MQSGPETPTLRSKPARKSTYDNDHLQPYTDSRQSYTDVHSRLLTNLASTMYLVFLVASWCVSLNLLIVVAGSDLGGKENNWKIQ